MSTDSNLLCLERAAVTLDLQIQEENEGQCFRRVSRSMYAGLTGGLVRVRVTGLCWQPHCGGGRSVVGKDPDAGRDWGQEEKGTTEDEMAGWHH